MSIERTTALPRELSADEVAAVALHEAGHSLAELVLRPKRVFVVEVFKRAEGRFAGQLRHPDSPRGDPGESESAGPPLVPEFAADLRMAAAIDSSLIRDGIAFYAGVAAEFPHFDGWTLEHSQSSCYDLRMLSEIALGYGRDLSPHQVWWRAFDRAVELVDAEWGAVVAIASALEERLCLTSAECAEIRSAAPRLANWQRPIAAPGERAADLPLPLLPDLEQRIRRAASVREPGE